MFNGFKAVSCFRFLGIFGSYSLQYICPVECRFADLPNHLRIHHLVSSIYISFLLCSFGGNVQCLWHFSVVLPLFIEFVHFKIISFHSPIWTNFGKFPNQNWIWFGEFYSATFTASNFIHQRQIHFSHRLLLNCICLRAPISDLFVHSSAKMKVRNIF